MIAEQATVSRRAFLCACLGICGLLCPRVFAASHPYLCLLGRVIDGSGREPVEDGAVLLFGGQIAAVGARAEVVVPPGAALLDLRPATILPGVINAHVHNVASTALRRELLLAGVTSVGDVGSPVAQLSALSRCRDTTENRVATAFFSGPMFSPPGGYPGRVWPGGYGMEVSGAVQARRGAKQLLDQGATMLKIAFEPGTGPVPWPVLGLDEAMAVVEVAHERGAVVRCHAQDLSGLSLALEAGVDTVEHTVLHSRKEPVFVGARGQLRPGPEYAGLLGRLAKEGIMLVPTLDVGTRSTWDDSGALAAVRLFHEAGGSLALGTDAPMRGVKFGLPLREMELLAQAGLSPLEVLCAATKGSARAVGQEHNLGRIEAGAVADIVVVAGDPLKDFAAMNQVVAVFKAGELVS